jgi:hypothetical protein
MERKREIFESHRLVNFEGLGIADWAPDVLCGFYHGIALVSRGAYRTIQPDLVWEFEVAEGDREREVLGP